MPDTTPPEPVDAELVEPGRVAVPDPGPVAPPPTPDYTDQGVPTLDYVRDKIEGRYATSLGAAELVGDTAAAHTVEQQEADREAKAKAKLDEIRRSLGR
jgi:hypothetical protein